MSSGKSPSRQSSAASSSPSPPSSSNYHNSRLPKFLQKANRDRSKSATDPGPQQSNGGAGGSNSSLVASPNSNNTNSPEGNTNTNSSSTSPPTPSSSSIKISRKSKLLGRDKDKDREHKDHEKEERRRSSFLLQPAAVVVSDKSSSSSRMSPPPLPPSSVDVAATSKSRMSAAASNNDVDEPPVIVEPVPPPSPATAASSSQAAPPRPSAPTPIPQARSRTRSERPLSTASELVHSHSLYTPSSSSRISDLPTRISGWFNHTFSSSTNDLSLPNILAQSHSAGSSPKTKLAAASFLTAIPGKAVRYIFDTDATPDKCTDSIWLLGVQHPGYEPPPPSPPVSVSGPSSVTSGGGGGGGGGGGAKKSSSSGRSSSSKAGSRRGSSGGSPSSFRSSIYSISGSSSSNELSGSTSTLAQSTSGGGGKLGWPPAFYADFTSRVWLTYRSQFPPIRDGRLADLGECGGAGAGAGAGGPTQSVVDVMAATSSPTTVRTRTWLWSSTAEKGWTSDSGWGCMLRTGQSLLANTLIHLHLGRDWRRPPYPVYTADYATYVQILTWFLDTPSPEAPFSVHRMALAGKELGKDVGQWFGPSTAAGAIRTLVQGFPECGLGVAVAIDNALYQTDVFTASHGGAVHARSPRKVVRTTWGDRPVLLLLGIRLGIDRVNPIYYDTIKQLYTFPQSVGIAGGRPSSSYYFVGSQANNLFYLDPHQSRHAIPLRAAPHHPSSGGSRGGISTTTIERDRETASESEKEFGVVVPSGKKHHHVKTTVVGGGGAATATATAAVAAGQRKQQQKKTGTTGTTTRHQKMPTSPSSVRTSGGGSSTYSHHAPTSPSPLQHQYSTSSSSASGGSTGVSSKSPPASQRQQHQNQHQHQGRRGSGSEDVMDIRELVMTTTRGSVSNGSEGASAASGGTGGSGNDESLIGGLDVVQQHYATAYSAAELKTFHCEQVRKMPMSGLDPSMLVGFFCRDEVEWVDFRRRVGELPRTMFSIQDEPPSWPSDSDDNMGLESISDPDDVDIDMDMDEDEDGDGEGEEIEEGEGEKEGGDEEDPDSDQFFDTRSRSSAEGCSSPIDGRRKRESAGKSDDTEEDPMGPLTPGPGSRFAIVDPKREGRKQGGEQEEGEVVVEDDDDDDDDEEWVDPSLSLPSSPVIAKADSQSPVIVEPPTQILAVASGRSTGSTSSGGKKSKSGSSGRKKKEGVPVIKAPPMSKVPQESREGRRKEREREREREKEQHYPFPVTPQSSADESEGCGGFTTPQDNRSRVNTTTITMASGGGGEEAAAGWAPAAGKRMNNARGRDGGRTQSGGVKGILTDQ
ncbi:hypothetical protein AMATHDRAFT_9389 [Amanita thiersii Skay4041]|uniref:Autophagy-related protein 4 n=1 Tax=Amanita thiersii Skay4041 TaxID=703135 RepID=A0A2A9NCE8_9AGAR|nr:hypothetical protein AMATHDRAFT_9389 [Amanita thiersii Skay4041]